MDRIELTEARTRLQQFTISFQKFIASRIYKTPVTAQSTRRDLWSWRCPLSCLLWAKV